jgi:UDP-N-acetylglucosamine:LPS N-acetylglucosamine transferase
MRALLAAVGTRGDVQPALALALELRERGHAVRLCMERLAGALRDALDPAVAARARTLATRIGWDGAAIAAMRLKEEYGGAKG